MVNIRLLFVIAFIVGVPIYLFRLVRKGPKDDLTRPFRFFNWGFLGSAGVLVLWNFELVIGLVLDSPGVEPQVTALIGAIGAVVVIVTGWMYWISLGVLAKRLGHSPIIWVCLSVITFPIGTIVAYFMMRSRVNKAMLDTPAGLPNAQSADKKVGG